MTNSESALPTQRVAFYGSAIVLLAREINVPIFTQLWFVRNGILAEQDFTPETVFSPQLVSIPTRNFALVILKDRIQLTATSLTDETSSFVEKVLGGIVRVLPHTPFFALGINFDINLRPPIGEPYAEWNRRLFGGNFAVQQTQALGLHPRFGSYFSVDSDLGFRVKCDIKPTHAEQLSGEPSEEIVWLNMNFHRDIPPETVPQILEYLSKWKDASIIADSVLNDLLK